MSRSGYSSDNDDNLLNLWRGNIARATAGKRGQRFFRELVAALDALPEKRLVDGDLETDDGAVCALGALRKAKGIALEPLGDSDWDALGEAFDIAPMLAQEVMYENDEGCTYDEAEHRVHRDGSLEERWQRMRKWAADQILPTEEPVAVVPS